jgi:hypothetical protein
MFTGREAVFARDLPHHLHESPGKPARPGVGCSDFVVGVKRRDVARKERRLVAHGVRIPRGFLFDDGAHQRWVEGVGGGDAPRESDE